MRDTIEPVDPGGVSGNQGQTGVAGSVRSLKRTNQPPQMIENIGPDILALVAKTERAMGDVQQVGEWPLKPRLIGKLFADQSPSVARQVEMALGNLSKPSSIQCIVGWLRVMAELAKTSKANLEGVDHPGVREVRDLKLSGMDLTIPSTFNAKEFASLSVLGDVMINSDGGYCLWWLGMSITGRVAEDFCVPRTLYDIEGPNATVTERITCLDWTVLVRWGRVACRGRDEKTAPFYCYTLRAQSQ
ncbi:hypothetical protein [Pseudomonas sp. S1(2024)]|uniref:hypothetical protein n=1 Tax=Pseudomonas sp. S1(2024) TaxID=3390191 RepID=UPI00397A59CE